jgi:hypothetical protein
MGGYIEWKRTCRASSPLRLPRHACHARWCRAGSQVLAIRLSLLLRFQMQLQAVSPYELFVEQGILYGVVRLGA